MRAPPRSMCSTSPGAGFEASAWASPDPGAARSGSIPRTSCARACISSGSSIWARSRRAAPCWCGERRPRRRLALGLRQGPGLLPLRAFHDHGRDLLLAHHAVEGGEVVVEQALELRELDVDPA